MLCGLELMISLPLSNQSTEPINGEWKISERVE